MTVKEMREKLGLSQAQFSLVYKIPKRSIENWESGLRKPPDYLLYLLERAVMEDAKEVRRSNGKEKTKKLLSLQT